MSQDPPARDVLAPAIAATAILSFVDVWRTWRRARAAGFDGTTDEPIDRLTNGLAEDLALLRTGLHRLRTESVGLSLHDTEDAVEVGTLGLVFTAGILLPVVRRIHQRLLSRYPEVEIETVEASRLLEAQLRRFVELRRLTEDAAATQGIADVDSDSISLADVPRVMVEITRRGYDLVERCV